MTTTATQSFRVVFSDGTVEREASDFGTAFIAALPTDGARVEAQFEGEWLPAHLAFAKQVLAARIGATVETFDGPLTKNSGTWAPGATRRASAVAAEGTEEWARIARTIPHEEATATSDGRGVVTKGWCSCGGGVEQVRYERWSARGREAHGFVCKTCRSLTQTG